jgi:hypothetical protein
MEEERRESNLRGMEKMRDKEGKTGEKRSR